MDEQRRLLVVEVLVGLLAALGTILGLLKVARSILRSEISEALILSLADESEKGAGTLVKRLLHSALEDALVRHPMHEQITDQRDRLLKLEEAVLGILTRTKE